MQVAVDIGSEITVTVTVTIVIGTQSGYLSICTKLTYWLQGLKILITYQCYLRALIATQAVKNVACKMKSIMMPGEIKYILKYRK